MDYKQAERRFQELQTYRERGDLGENTFRVKVAKLMFRDAQGVFWMIDPDDGAWYCNRGATWEPGDPRVERAAEPVPPSTIRRRRWQYAGLGAALLVLLGLAVVLVYQQWPGGIWNAVPPAPTLTPEVQVSIASPSDASQVAVGQGVAVESMLDAAGGLQGVDRVELLVGGRPVDSQAVKSRLQPGQTSLPVSQYWMPTDLGEQEVAVIALSGQDEPLGKATINLVVTELADESLPEPVCSPDAAFVADVTIPPGTTFPPEARMDKVWQVRNSGTCAWGVGYQLLRVEGGALGAPDLVPVPPTAAGATADLAITFDGPSQAGTYTDTWRLHTPDGAPFGPDLTLFIAVEADAETNLPPEAPTEVQAAVTEDGTAVQLTWLDQSGNEDAFRVYRDDMEASIGLAPADAELFVDRTVACGHTYEYRVVAFNAAGASPVGETAEATLPSCTPVDAPPTLVLTVVPTQVVASGTITVAFQASDDVGLAQVLLKGRDTGNAALDAGLVFACENSICAATRPVTLSLTALGITPTAQISGTAVIVGVARDSTGQESPPQELRVIVLPQE
jgi:hypothetical protein